jgi:hypothetical protein
MLTLWPFPCLDARQDDLLDRSSVRAEAGIVAGLA